MQELILQNNFIGGWFLEDTSICDRLINYYEFQKERAVEGTTFVGVNHELKKCKEIYFEYKEYIMKEYAENYLQKVCDEYIKKYPFCDSNACWSTKENIKIQKYEPGEGYHAWHCERGDSKEPAHNRHLAYLTYLNDVTDCGETEFYHQNLKVRPQKGLTLIWPTDWTHTHRGLPSMTQTKYIITGWFHYI